jgi:acyl-coenzyme A synthetase/AMP-(fatty) acid ligase
LRDVDCRGEKIAPVEIDGILLSHPAVAEAVCFGVPDGMYGQEIHAAVVFKQGKSVKEQELQKWVDEKVAKFKIPKKVYPFLLALLMPVLLYRSNSEDGDWQSTKGQSQ